MRERRRPRDPDRTRGEMVAAAAATLREEGYAGTTARAIASRGGFNQALIFYHYGGVDELLLAALDASSAERLESYRATLRATSSVAELIDAVERLYEQDLAAGHITLATELVGAALARPELAPEVLARMEPWLELTEQTFTRLLADSPLRDAVPVRDASYAFVSLYLGLNLLSRLDPAAAPTKELFALLRVAAPLLDGAG